MNTQKVFQRPIQKLASWGRRRGIRLFWPRWNQTLRFKSRQHIGAVCARIDLFVEPDYPSIFANENRHPRRHLLVALNRAKGEGNLAVGVGQKRKWQFQLLGEGALTLWPVGGISRNRPHLDARFLKLGIRVAERGELMVTVAGEGAREEGDQKRPLALKRFGASLQSRSIARGNRWR